MTMRNQSRGVIALALAICFLSIAASLRGHVQSKGATQTLDGVPMFRVDPFRPKLLPNRWSMQQVTGLYVEKKNDHVWFLNRGAAADGDEIGGGEGNPPRIACCVRGPEVIELDPEGNVLSAWTKLYSAMAHSPTDHPSGSGGQRLDRRDRSPG